MKKKCKILLLPASKQDNQVSKGDIFINDTREYDWGKLEALKCERVTQHGHAWNGGGIRTGISHLYILSEDKIEEGDWVLGDGKKLVQADIRHVGEYPSEYWKKIIATTDKSLWKRVPHPEGSVKGDLPSIPQQFIEEYCKNPVDEIEVEYHCKTCSMTTGRHKMSCKDSYTREYVPKLNNNKIIIYAIEGKMNKVENYIKRKKYKIEAANKLKLWDSKNIEKEYLEDIKIVSELDQENKELREELKLTYLDSKAKTVKLNEAKSRIEELEDLLFNCSCSIYKEDSESDIKYEKRVQALKNQIR